jgi:hypothetical protein
MGDGHRDVEVSANVPFTQLGANQPIDGLEEKQGRHRRGGESPFGGRRSLQLRCSEVLHRCWSRKINKQLRYWSDGDERGIRAGAGAGLCRADSYSVDPGLQQPRWIV